MHFNSFYNYILRKYLPTKNIKYKLYIKITNLKKNEFISDCLEVYCEITSRKINIFMTLN